MRSAGSLIEKDVLVGVELADGRIVARTAVFIRPGNLPHTDGLLSGLACELDEAGFPVVDGTGRTSVSGVWAAGNVADPRAQVITSAGAGSAAAIAINVDLVQEDVRNALGVRNADEDGGHHSLYDATGALVATGSSTIRVVHLRRGGD